MKNNFKVKVNSKWDFEISKEDIQTLDAASSSEDLYHILQNNKSYKAKIVDTDFDQRNYSVELNGTVYEVSIANQLDQLIKKMGFSVGNTKNVKLIKAPMPGLVLEVNVEVGQEVAENDALLVLEAMKMESTLASPSSGIVKNIAIKSGETVDKGQLLIEFE
ncbi:MAG: acetyl-CoA carboxylase biotin carboxyl carrier protein subunit [Flavobacteriaceae bacterium]|nr:acetyl-CoA carboxylase biotin carboxyl carrier protein subunit [Flavobacteriaceae bacterium]